MLELLIAIIFLLLIIAISGFFIWIGLKMIGKKVGIIEAGLANIASGFFAIAAGSIVSILPFFGIFAPIVAYFVYLYMLKALLNVSLLEAFVASIIASIVFMAVSSLFAALFGVILIKFFPFIYKHPAGIRF